MLILKSICLKFSSDLPIFPNVGQCWLVLYMAYVIDMCFSGLVYLCNCINGLFLLFFSILSPLPKIKIFTSIITKYIYIYIPIKSSTSFTLILKMKIQTTFIKSKQTKFIIKKKKKTQFHSTNQNHNQITKNPKPQNKKFSSHKTPKKAKMFSYLSSEIFEHNREINRSTSTNTLDVLSSLEKPSNQCAMWLRGRLRACGRVRARW